MPGLPTCLSTTSPFLNTRRVGRLWIPYVTALFWFYILTRVPLSTAYAFSVIGSGLVPLIAWLVFKEQLTWHFAAGYVLMLAGFALTLQGRPA